MLAYTYQSPGVFTLTEKPKPVLQQDHDAIVRVTLASICTSDLHIKHGSVPRAVPGITVGHEMVGVVEQVGDLLSIENTGQYNGLYHVLGGVISPIQGVSPSDLHSVAV